MFRSAPYDLRGTCILDYSLSGLELTSPKSWLPGRLINLKHWYAHTSLPAFLSSAMYSYKIRFRKESLILLGPEKQTNEPQNQKVSVAVPHSTSAQTHSSRIHTNVKPRVYLFPGVSSQQQQVEQGILWRPIRGGGSGRTAEDVCRGSRKNAFWNRGAPTLRAKDRMIPGT